MGFPWTDWIVLALCLVDLIKVSFAVVAGKLRAEPAGLCCNHVQPMFLCYLRPGLPDVRWAGRWAAGQAVRSPGCQIPSYTLRNVFPGGRGFWPESGTVQRQRAGGVKSYIGLDRTKEEGHGGKFWGLMTFLSRWPEAPLWEFAVLVVVPHTHNQQLSNKA